MYLKAQNVCINTYMIIFSKRTCSSWNSY